MQIDGLPENALTHLLRLRTVRRKPYHARMTVVPSVAVLASANFDLVGRAATLPRPGETVLGEGFTTNPGGKGLNQAIAVARLGGACATIAAVGDDSF